MYGCELAQLLRTVGLLCLLLIVYLFIQMFYVLPDDFGSFTYWIKVALIIGITTVIFLQMWKVYKKQLQKNNPFGIATEFRYEVKKLGIVALGVLGMLVIQFIYLSFFGNRVSENQEILNQMLDTNMAAILAPVFEELIFRGFLLNGFFEKNSKANKIIAIVIGGLIFGMLHEPRISIFLLVYSSMGMILMATYLWTKDLRCSILVHLINNALSII